MASALAGRILDNMTDRIEADLLRAEDLATRAMAASPNSPLPHYAKATLLRAQGRFTVPQSSADAITMLEDLSSPIRQFIREQCEVGAGHEIEVDVLYEVWKIWCQLQGRDRFTTKQVFGRDLRAALPSVKIVRPRSGDTRYRVYRGIGPKRAETSTSDGDADHSGPDTDPSAAVHDGPRSNPMSAAPPQCEHIGCTRPAHRYVFGTFCDKHVANHKPIR